MIRSHLWKLLPRKRTFLDYFRNLSSSSPHKQKFDPSKPSDEQRAIIEACRTHNCIVKARPGSGKTSTALALVHHNWSRNAIIITYSKRLQSETNRSLGKYGLSADVLTFHGLAGQLFGLTVQNDDILGKLRRANPAPDPNSNLRPPYEFVVIDEVQDMTEDLYWLSCRFLTYLKEYGDPRILLIGDPMQSIFDYRGADARYLEKGDELFSGLSPYEWRHLDLSQSFRLSISNATFVNRFTNKEDYIVGTDKAKGEKPPIYIHADPYDKDNSLSKELGRIITDPDSKYKSEDVAILAPSIRRNSALIRLEHNLLWLPNLRLTVPISDETPLDDKTLKGKAIITTFHQFKGIQRRLVIVFGIEDGYFDHAGRRLSDDRCPNAMFVALTRATDQLVIVQSSNSRPVPFTTGWEDLLKSIKFVNLTPQKPKARQKPKRVPQFGLSIPPKSTVTNLCRHLREDMISELVDSHLTVTEDGQLLDPIEIPSVVPTDSARTYHESVSDINGIAVLAAFEHKMFGTCKTLNLGRVDSNESLTNRWFAEEATRHSSGESGYISRWNEMRNHPFGWMKRQLEATTNRLEEQFVDYSKLHFEYSLEGDYPNELNLHVEKPKKQGKKRKQKQPELSGRVDIYAPPANGQPPTIWEIKFVSSLSIAHVAQLALYGYLWCISDVGRTIGGVPRLILYNVYNGEKKEVKAGTPEDLRRFVEGLIRIKYTSVPPLSDDEFFERCRAIQTLAKNPKVVTYLE